MKWALWSAWSTESQRMVLENTLTPNWSVVRYILPHHFGVKVCCVILCAHINAFFTVLSFQSKYWSPNLPVPVLPASITIAWDLKFSLQWRFGWWSFGLWGPVYFQVRTSVSEEHIATIFRCSDDTALKTAIDITFVFVFVALQIASGFLSSRSFPNNFFTQM
jgi:hypothetical protein